MKAVVAAFNQEKALVAAFTVIVRLHRLIVTSTKLTSSSLFTSHQPQLRLCNHRGWRTPGPVGAPATGQMGTTDSGAMN